MGGSPSVPLALQGLCYESKTLLSLQPPCTGLGSVTRDWAERRSPGEIIILLSSLFSGPMI